MQDDLQKAYSAYQQALYWLPNPKDDPKLWYGIGILYDRYGSLDHAEEAFASVLRMDRGAWRLFFFFRGCGAVRSAGFFLLCSIPFFFLPLLPFAMMFVLLCCAPFLAVALLSSCRASLCFGFMRVAY